MKALFKHKYRNSDACSLLKNEINWFLLREISRDLPQQATVPQEVAVSDNRTIVTTASTHDEMKTVDKKNLIAFLQIFFVRLEYDRTGNISMLHPGFLTNEALELL